MKTDTLTNPNSPEIVLGGWLKLISADIAGHEFVINDLDVTAGALLAMILEFADKHSRLLEMYEWLTSTEGHEFLRRDEYQPAGNMVKSELFMFDNDLESNLEFTKLQLTMRLRDYVDDYFIMNKHRLYLRNINA